MLRGLARLPVAMVVAMVVACRLYCLLVCLAVVVMAEHGGISTTFKVSDDMLNF